MTNTTDYQVIASPCIGVCKLNENKICAGCFRSSEEITYWRIYSDEERQEIGERLKMRAEAISGS